MTRAPIYGRGLICAGQALGRIPFDKLRTGVPTTAKQKPYVKPFGCASHLGHKLGMKAVIRELEIRELERKKEKSKPPPSTGLGAKQY